MNLVSVVAGSLCFLFVAALVTMALSKHTAKKVLHPVSKRKPLDAWPDQFGLPYENVTFQTEDKVQLKGWFITGPEESDKTIIIMHSWGMNRSDMLKRTHFLRDLGFNLFYFDFRAQGESNGKTSSIGYLELKDIAAAVRFLQDTRPQFCAKIGLYGFSLGGAVALVEAARNPEVACVVAEASYYSLRGNGGHRRGLFFPFTALVLHYMRKRLGTDPEKYSPKYNIARIAPRPVFLIHGRNDNLVSAAQAKLLYKQAGEPKESWLVPGADHAQCAEVGGFEYKQRLADFFKRQL